VSTQSAEIEKYCSIAIKNVLDELNRKLNFCLKLKDGQSKALYNILDGNDVFAVYKESLANTTVNGNVLISTIALYSETKANIICILEHSSTP
jgi:hypothetical protein